MRIVIISDIHDNLVNLEKCLNWCRKRSIKNLICCGDITNSETLNFLSKKFAGNIYLVRGNIELYDEKEISQYGNISFLGKFGVIKLGGRDIGVCHEPYLVEKIKEEDNPDIIFYGHTHKPWQSKKSGTKLINPGTLAGTFSRATFAAWDAESGELELKLLEDL